MTHKGDEARAEVERLRGERDEQQAAHREKREAWHSEIISFRDEVERLRGEIARLRAEVEHWKQTATEHGRTVLAQEQLIERLRQALKSGLEGLGSVRVAHDCDSGEAALAYCLAHRPDVILMDVELAGEVNGIEAAVAMAGPDDLVLIAGKGHETYQIFADRTIHFDDREVAAEALAGERCRS